MKKIIILFVCIILFTPPVIAEVVHIPLESAVALALENNVDLQAKRKKSEELKQDVKIANALKNPQFQSNFLMGKVTRGNSSQFGLALPVEIGKRGVRKKAALAELDIMENEIKAFEHNLKIEVMRKYYNVLYMKSVVLILKDRERMFNRVKSTAMQKPKNSPNYDIEVLQNDIKYQKQLIFLNKAKADLLNAQFELNNAMNIRNSSAMYDTEEESLFVDGLPFFDFELLSYSDIEKTAMEYSYALAISEDTIKRNEFNSQLAGRQRIPDITIGGGYAYQTAHQAGGEAFPGAYAGVSFDIPILYNFSPEIKKSKIVVERSKIDKESFENHLKYSLKEDYNSFKYAKENLLHYESIIKDYRTVLNSYKKRYEKGQVSLSNLFQVENYYQENLREYINATKVYYEAYLSLMQNVGHDILLPDNL